ncbi:hypothetical protein [Rhizobium sp. 768_B6_N1_8]|uniref:hypothetical protein n=1 Tax=unclassified Rhizobium TaxID=2613769 RepID=UPI003F22C662
MTSIDRAASAIATILIREGIDYPQSKAVHARAQAGDNAALLAADLFSENRSIRQITSADA